MTKKLFIAAMSVTAIVLTCLLLAATGPNSGGAGPQPICPISSYWCNIVSGTSGTSLITNIGIYPLVPGTGISFSTNANKITITSTGVGTNGGTVTSVSLTGDGTYSNSPAVTTSGTLTLNTKPQTSNTFNAGPSSGAAAQPTWRALVFADISPFVGTASLSNAAAFQPADAKLSNLVSGASFVANGAGLTNLNGSSIASGTVAAARLDPTFGPTNGSNITNLNAANLTGSIADARLSANVALLNGTQTFTGAKSFTNVGNIFVGDGSGLTGVTGGSGIATSNGIGTNTTFYGDTIISTATGGAAGMTYESDVSYTTVTNPTLAFGLNHAAATKNGLGNAAWFTGTNRTGLFGIGFLDMGNTNLTAFIAARTGAFSVSNVTVADSVTVAGTAAANNFRMTNGASNGKVATSDAAGNFSWVTPSGGSSTPSFDTINVTNGATIGGTVTAPTFVGNLITASITLPGISDVHITTSGSALIVDAGITATRFTGEGDMLTGMEGNVSIQNLYDVNGNLAASAGDDTYITATNSHVWAGDAGGLFNVPSSGVVGTFPSSAITGTFAATVIPQNKGGITTLGNLVTSNNVTLTTGYTDTNYTISIQPANTGITVGYAAQVIASNIFAIKLTAGVAGGESFFWRTAPYNNP